MTAEPHPSIWLTRDGRRHPAALPVRFSGCAGLFSRADAGAPVANSAVLLVSPWGFEEMCLRKFYRETGEALAARGIASLRFDLPGTGDSSDPEGGPSLESWGEAIKAAAAELQRLSGVRNLILAGHGLGATLALTAADEIADVTGLALLAPVTSGRTYVRETGLWWKMVAADLHIDPQDGAGSSLSIAGLELPEIMTAEIKKLKAQDLLLQRPLKVLAVSRPSSAGGEELAKALEDAGSSVERLGYTGYEALMTNPMLSRVPESVVEGLADWARSISPVEAPDGTAEFDPESALAGEGYVETGIRFAEDGRLSGTICEPVGARRGASVLIVGTSYDRASGWGRTGVKTARALARQGLASLRFDAAGVGDSPACPGDPEQILYASCIDRDVSSALSELVGRLPGPAVLSGRCSGGYHAFHAALSEPACRGVVSINSYAFVWDPDCNFDEALAGVARPLGVYSQRALDLQTFKRIARGEVDVKRAVVNIARQIGKAVAGKFAPLPGSQSGSSLKNEIRTAFRKLEADGKSVALVYGEDDPGLEQFRLMFGVSGERVKDYPNVVHVSLGKVDHNVTSAAAQDRVIAAIADMALKTG